MNGYGPFRMHIYSFSRPVAILAPPRSPGRILDITRDSLRPFLVFLFVALLVVLVPSRPLWAPRRALWDCHGPTLSFLTPPGHFPVGAA